MSKSRVEGTKSYLQRKGVTTLVFIEQYVSKETEAIKSKIKTHSNGCVWIFVEASLMKVLLRNADKLDGMSNFVRIISGDLEIKAIHHTSKWWKIKNITGGCICFNEPEDPAGVVFMKMED